MSEPTVQAPGFWRFVWLFFMQPVTLHRLLRGAGIDPKENLWGFWRKRRSLQSTWFLVRSAQTLLVLTPGAARPSLDFAGRVGYTSTG